MSMDEERTAEKFRDHLVCYRDTKEATAVCGDCGRPVCGPVMNASIRGLISSVFKDHGHARRFNDSRFHYYESGLRRLFFGLGLIGLAILLSFVFPGVLSGLVSDGPDVLKELNSAVVQSSIILGVTLLVTLRYQGGERKTNFRIRVRKTTKRVVCDECLENNILQILLSYALVAIGVVVILIGVQNIVNETSVLPVRLIAASISLWMLGPDIINVIIGVLSTDTEIETEQVKATGGSDD